MASLSRKQLDRIDYEFKSAGYPRSKYFVCGCNLAADNHLDLAIASFKRGAKNGCVPCMFFYIRYQDKRGKK